MINNGKIGVIIVAGSKKQKECFWPSYFNAQAGIDHDLIVIHRNMQHVPELELNVKVILENKIFKHGELPHKAFGAYRYFWYKYKDKYEFLAFISDDVIIKSDNWLLNSVKLLDNYDNLGFVGSQIFNGNLNQYPHESHCRAPLWFAKSSAIKKIKWEFNSDHDGEMRIANQFLESGFYGAQTGNKIDMGYDALENGGKFKGDHISAQIEKYFNHNLNDKFTIEEQNNINNKLVQMLVNAEDSITISSPFSHIGKRKLISQLQPFNGLIYDRSIELAKKDSKQLPFETYILANCI